MSDRESKDKLIKENKQDAVTNLLLMLDIDNVQIIYPNKDSLTSEKIFRQNICDIITYMYELASLIDNLKSSAKITQKIISIKEEKIKQLEADKAELNRISPDKDKVIDEIKSIIENEFDTFTIHDNNFNLGDMQLLQDMILDKIAEKVEEL